MARSGGPWSECFICGEDYPESEMVRYKSTGIAAGRLVDILCADEMDASDFRETQILPTEGTKRSERPVADQGQQGLAQDFGAGFGGAGWGPAGGSD